MELILIDIIRYFIGGLFGFSIFNHSKHLSIKKIIFPSFIYAACLILFKIFIADSPITTVVSAITIFAYLILDNKFKSFNFLLVYSLFIGYLIECTHFLLFLIVSLISNASHFPEVPNDHVINFEIIAFRATVALLYAIALLLIYKRNLINLESIRKLSGYKTVPIFLAVALSVIIYLKYYIKYTPSNEFHNILSVIFLFFTITSFIFIVSAKTFVNKLDKFEEKKINLAIEEAQLKKGQRYAGMNFISEKLRSEMECL